MATEPDVSSWQSRLLPFMSVIVVGLAIFFFVTTMYQLRTLQNAVASPPEKELQEALTSVRTASTATSEPVFAHASWAALANLEANALAQRYHMARVSLMARMWARYLGFATGMILAVVGSAFVLGKLRETKANVNVDTSFAKFAVVSSSPGIILAVLGTALMMTTILTNPEITVNDAMVYLRQSDEEGVGVKLQRPRTARPPGQILKEEESLGNKTGGNP